MASTCRLLRDLEEMQNLKTSGFPGKLSWQVEAVIVDTTSERCSLLLKTPMDDAFFALHNFEPKRIDPGSHTNAQLKKHNDQVENGGRRTASTCRLLRDLEEMQNWKTSGFSGKLS